MPDNPVANAPAGGPQEFASTNDDNINDVLHDKPHVVTISAHGQVGVISRYANTADAEAASAAAKARRPGFADVKVVKENDPKNGLPALLAEVEGAEAAANDTGDTTDTTTTARTPTATSSVTAKAGR